MSAKLRINIKWERLVGFIILLVIAVTVWKRALYVTSADAFINAEVRGVYSLLFGQLKMEDIDPGESFKENEILFEVNNPHIGAVGIFTDYYNLQHRINLIEMEIAQEQISVKKYKDDLLRDEGLLKLGGVTKESVEETRYKLNMLNSEIENKNSQLTNLKESIQKTAAQLESLQSAMVRSPVNGAIWSVFHKNGEFVKAGDIILQVIDQDNVWVDAFFDEKEARYLSPGSSVTVIADTPERQWQGRIIFTRWGEFQNDQYILNDSIARPKLKAEKGLIAVHIKTEWNNAFPAKEFYGHGKKVIVRIKKHPQFSSPQDLLNKITGKHIRHD